MLPDGRPDVEERIPEEYVEPSLGFETDEFEEFVKEQPLIENWMTMPATTTTEMKCGI